MFHSKDFVLFALGFSLHIWFEGRDPEFRTFYWEVALRADTEDDGPDPSEEAIVNQTEGSRYLVLSSLGGLKMICPPVISGQVECKKPGILHAPWQINAESGQTQTVSSSQAQSGYRSVGRDRRIQVRISEALTFKVASKVTQFTQLFLSDAVSGHDHTLIPSPFLPIKLIHESLYFHL